ncbi:hypothetical protein I41_05020 [Lacipirellula limnantheis]|uniref:Uncharacterized protein n=1 Tax=Lacipirellula limnantheis TaxID=2528024 RepID=A0A517TSJ4_9BACT|nr:hypothetical protein I41_05020 [Lacipirellula limnantheis]
MILRAELLNLLPSGDLGQARKDSCTYCCTPVEVSAQLANLIVAWPSLTDAQRRELELLLRTEPYNNLSDS